MNGIQPGQSNSLQEIGGRCGNAFNTGMIRIALQCGTLIILSHILHRLVFRRIGQPLVISQIFTGLLVGPTVLGRLKAWHELILGNDSTRIMGSIATIGRMLFMFLVGLEMDIPFLRRSLRRASFISLGSATSSIVAAIGSAPIIYRATAPNGNPILFSVVLALLYANTASPVVIRMCTELKLSASEFGRLAVSSSILNDMSCLLILAVATTARHGAYSKRTGEQKLIGSIIMLLLLAAAAAALRPVVRWMNRRNVGQGHVQNFEVTGLLFFVLLVAVAMETMGYNSSMSCFMLGVVMPREGGVLRTTVDTLSYPVNNFVLPIIFGYAAISMDVMTIRGNMAGAVVLMVALNVGSKVLGAIAATSYLGMPLNEGIVLGFLLNIKGHADLVLVSLARGAKIWGEESQKVLLVAALILTLTAGPVATLVIQFERRAFHYCAAALHSRPPETELRVLACVHGSRDVPTMLNLVEISAGGGQTESALAVYLMHLVKLTARTTSYMLYHQHDAEDEGGWEQGDDTQIVTAAADMFCVETGIGIRQMTVVSAAETMQDDVYNFAVDLRASLVVVPFHKHRRVDGRMQTKSIHYSVGKTAVQQFNERVMDRIPCTVGVLVDRGLDGGGCGGNSPAVVADFIPLLQVAVLFFGGEDDREALAFGVRLALHPCVALTVIRFLPETSDDEAGLKMAAINDSVDAHIAMSEHQRELNADDSFLSAFMSGSIPAGRSAYVEKVVKDAAETVAAICSMNNKYYLFIVGRGRDRVSPLTRGMCDWEECPELGSVGDLLASSDIMCSASVLIMRGYQNRKFRNDSDDEDEFCLI